MLARELGAVARAHHRAHPEGAPASRIATWLGALLPRVMHPGGWTTAARFAGAEPLWTGRARPYDESTLRCAADRLEAEGGVAHVAAVLRRQVDRAVRATGDEVVAYTDVFDQPWYTKAPAHAGPVGRLGNRLLGATYFGLTTVALEGGPTLFLHLSWHKPATPLGDALHDLLDDEARLAWWQRNVRLHIWDRGANGDAVLAWAWALEVPYLTIGRQRAELWRFRAPTARNDVGLPITVRPDTRLAGTTAEGPWEVVVPADPENPAETNGIRFRAGVTLTAADLLVLNARYKSRWPSMENELKALQARGFGRNRTRRRELTTGRGTDGAMERLRAREAERVAKVEALGELPATRRTIARLLTAAGKVGTVRAKQVALTVDASRKYARPEGGSEWLGKWLHLLAHNALALALHASAEAEVRSLETPAVFELLLGRAALTCIEHGRLTLWVDALDAAADRRRQAALIEVFNRLGLKCRGRVVTIRLHDRPAAVVI